MKKLAVVIAIVFATGIAAAAMAFDLPSKVPTNTNELKNAGGSMALQTALNKEVEKANCTSFKGNTTSANCDLKKLADKLAAASKASKEAGNYNVYVNIEAGPGEGKKAKVEASERANVVRDQLKSGLGGLADSWRYNTNTTSQTNKLAISVKVEK
jgi:hypothetical protein